MKKITFLSILACLVFSSCISVPQETVTLSRTMGVDLQALHNSHRSLVELYFGQIKDDVNKFVNDVYAPYIIHYVLKKELTKYKNNQPSLYGDIMAAGEKDTKSVADSALTTMQEFQEAVGIQIQKKRDELLGPIEKKEEEVVNSITQSYEKVIYANASITTYLGSIRKVKVSQEDALSKVGLQGADSSIGSTLAKVSNLVKVAVSEGDDIDVKSTNALNQIEAISKTIKELTN